MGSHTSSPVALLLGGGGFPVKPEWEVSLEECLEGAVRVLSGSADWLHCWLSALTKGWKDAGLYEWLGRDTRVGSVPTWVRRRHLLRKLDAAAAPGNLAKRRGEEGLEVP